MDVIRRIQGLLPSGGSLPDDVWTRRHRWILALLWVQAPGLAAFGLLRGYRLGLVVMEASAIAAFALLAGLPVESRKLRSGMASVGLMTSSAILVHLSGGVIEAHFAFFVMIGVLSMYQDWLPFLLSVGYVVVHHGLLGTIDPHSVYDHTAAAAGPWKWSLIHGVFVTAASLAYVAAWRLNEEARAQAKESHQRLQDSMERYRLLFDSNPHPMWVYNEESLGFLAVNDAAVDRYGYSRDEFLAMTIKDIRPREDVPALLENVSRTISPLDRAGTWRHLTKDGTVFDVEITSHALLFAGTPSRLVMANDVTERKRAEEGLRGAEERFHSAFENAPIGMSLVDLDGRFIQVNRAFSDITGYEGAELLGKSSQSITHPEDLESDLQHLRRMAAGEIDHYQIETRFLHSAGHPVWTRVSRSLVRGNEGEPLHLVSQVEDITQRKQSDLMLTHMALHDSLTGLPNRTLALDRLSLALARTERHPFSVAVLFLDLDRFKVINDSLGHNLGDQLLVAVAARLREAVRPSDTVARIGGDEFVVVCEDITGVEDAARIAERIAHALTRPFDLEDDEVLLATSVGIALSSGPGDTPETLLRDADAAMYRAKESGRNRYEVFDSSMRVQAVERLDMEQALRRALGRSEFRLFYQPVLDMETGTVVGVEALLRWDHPERGLLRPAEFISLAEETGLILPIGTWALQEACRQAQIWREADPDQPPLTIAVNLSARQLAQPDVADMVAEALESTGTDPGQVWLEITESVLTGETDVTVGALRALKALGVRLSVDDFGTGYSSLLYLKRFPVDTLKVDRSFVAGLGTNADDTAIVAGVVGLAQTLGLTAIAEGVETEKQRAALQALGCDLAQGYLFGYPEPAEDRGELPDPALASA
jgi:diguanylate cyclase (GGDEF)-like protein/PAS domain S-box-containing protein